MTAGKQRSVKSNDQETEGDSRKLIHGMADHGVLRSDVAGQIFLVHCIERIRLSPSPIKWLVYALRVCKFTISRAPARFRYDGGIN